MSVITPASVMISYITNCRKERYPEGEAKHAARIAERRTKRGLIRSCTCRRKGRAAHFRRTHTWSDSHPRDRSKHCGGGHSSSNRVLERISCVMQLLDILGLRLGVPAEEQVVCKDEWKGKDSDGKIPIHPTFVPEVVYADTSA